MFTRIRHLLEMIKFSHTVFAFPFALMGATLASLANGHPPELRQIGWICVAMVGARNAAMGLNRLIDASIDAENPRTATRHIPAGTISKRDAWIFVSASTLLLLMAAWQLNPLCFYLSPLVLAFFILYAYCKRFTSMAHVVLGICLAGAPIGAWIALRDSIEWPILVLGLAVLFWVAGFDIFYALQDREFDAKKGLHSLPVRLGERKAILLGKIFHGLMIALLLTLPFGLPLGMIYYAGIGVISLMIAWEHHLVRPGDLSKLDAAFFNMNGYISVTIFLFTLADVLMKRGAP